MLFKDIPLSDQLHRQLISLKSTGKIPHSIMFHGREGSGNLAIAFAFARFILCENPSETDSCGTCSTCKKTEKLTYPDLFFTFPYVGTTDIKLSTHYYEFWREMLLSNPFPTTRDWQIHMKAEKKKINYYVAELRDIGKRLNMKTYGGKSKIMIIWLPEYMESAGNILLKLIEEPPPNTLFFLVTEDMDSILTTIQSRSQKIKVQNPSIQNIVPFLKNIDPEIDNERAQTVAMLCNGNLNHAINLLQDVQEPFFDMFREWFLHIFRKDFRQAFAFIEKIKDNRDTTINFLNYGLQLIRKSFVFSQNSINSDLTSKEQEFVANFANTMKNKSFFDLYTLFNETIVGIERNGNTKLMMTDFIVNANKILNNKAKQ